MPALPAPSRTPPFTVKPVPLSKVPFALSVGPLTQIVPPLIVSVPPVISRYVCAFTPFSDGASVSLALFYQPMNLSFPVFTAAFALPPLVVMFSSPPEMSALVSACMPSQSASAVSTPPPI